MKAQSIGASEKRIKVPKQTKALVAVVVIVAMAFGGGYALGQSKSGSSNALASSSAPQDLVQGEPKGLPSDVDFKLFWDVWQQVKGRYVKQPVSDSDLFQGAMEGMVSALDDPYSMYFKPAFAEEFARDLAGTFEGIGAEVGIKGDVITVIAPLPDTPASKAGLRAGDKIIAIDDKTTAGMSVEEAVNLIRGKGGTKVTLTIARNGDKEPRKFEIVREKIVVKSVRSEVKKTKSGATIGYIQIRQFNDETSALTKNAVADLLKQSPKGIIIDLRNNPGGYLDAAVDVAGEWMTGPVVYERKYDGTETAVEAKGATPLKDIPTIVLVNQGSASGSEILAGALQDAGQARLVGKKTFGKGSVQDYEELKNGGALKLTVAEWLTPKKRSINKEGIAPDIEVDLTEEDANADKDPQLAKALELLEPAAVAAAAAH